MIIATLRAIFDEWLSLSTLPFGPELLTILSVVAVYFVIRFWDP